MCDKSLEGFSTKEIILELSKRNCLTNSKSNNEIINNLEHGVNPMVILTKGIPVEEMECRECRRTLHPSHFSYYLSRVDQNGFLMRSNALCIECASVSNKERKKVLDNSPITDKPKKGDKCPSCDRSWRGNWHRHHVGDKFIEWLCGHCNMSLSDQRNLK